ncbi:MAG: hypothetical protein ACK5C5_05845 [Bacteroidota bacterium]|jgi:hypothetical protein
MVQIAENVPESKIVPLAPTAPGANIVMKLEACVEFVMMGKTPITNLSANTQQGYSQSK